MKNYNKKKIITISVLAVVAVFLAGGLWLYIDSMGKSEPAAVISDDPTQEPDGSEAPEIKVPLSSGQDTQAGETKGDGSGTTASPNAGNATSTTGSGASGQSKTSDDKPKTPAEATPPHTPEHVVEDEHEITSTDDPNVPPSSTPTPAKPETDTPKSGDTNSNGAIYVPGFGWVEDSGDNVQEKGDFELSGEIIGQ